MGTCTHCGDETPLLVEGIRTCWFCRLREQELSDGVASVLKDIGYSVYTIDGQGRLIPVKAALPTIQV
jgi:hypothetical protein